MALSTNLTLLKSMQNFLREGFNQGICLIEASNFLAIGLVQRKGNYSFLWKEKKKPIDIIQCVRFIHIMHTTNKWHLFLSG